jgi:sodium transport system permease protein
MVQPFTFAVMIPILFLSQPGTELTFGLAAVPVVNVALVTREALAGVYRLPQIAVAAGASILAIAALVRVATAVVEAEDVMVGSYRGSFISFLRERLRGWKGRAR